MHLDGGAGSPLGPADSTLASARHSKKEIASALARASHGGVCCFIGSWWLPTHGSGKAVSLYPGASAWSLWMDMASVAPWQTVGAMILDDHEQPNLLQRKYRPINRVRVVLQSAEFPCPSHVRNTMRSEACVAHCRGIVQCQGTCGDRRDAGRCSWAGHV